MKRIGSVWSLEKLSLVVVAMTTVTGDEKTVQVNVFYGPKRKQFLKTQVYSDSNYTLE